MTNDFTVRAAAVDATDVVREMQHIQQSFPLATVGVGRSMVGAILLASHLKDGQEVGLLFKGNGPLGSLYAEASYSGNVRGYCPHPTYQAPDLEDALNLGKALGFGTLNVARHQPFQKNAFHGTVQMQSGEVGEDIAHYLHQSQQIRSIVSLGVFVDAYGKVQAAGGLLVEVMPGVESEIVEVLEKNVKRFTEPVSKRLMNGEHPLDLIKTSLYGLEFTEIPHDFKLKYHCPCTQDRVYQALTILGEEDLQDLITKGEPADVECQICGRKYSVPSTEIQEIRDKLRRNSLH